MRFPREVRRLDDRDAAAVGDGIDGVTLVQLSPAFRVTCTCPSSDPVQITPAVTGDSAIVKTVA